MAKSAGCRRRGGFNHPEVRNRTLFHGDAGLTVDGIPPRRRVETLALQPRINRCRGCTQDCSSSMQLGPGTCADHRAWRNIYRMLVMSMRSSPCNSSWILGADRSRARRCTTSVVFSDLASGRSCVRRHAARPRLDLAGHRRSPPFRHRLGHQPGRLPQTARRIATHR